MKLLKNEKNKLKPDLKLADLSDGVDLKFSNGFDLRTMDCNIIVDFLDDQIKEREIKVEDKLKRLLKK